MVCPCTLQCASVLCPGTSELVGQQEFLHFKLFWWSEMWSSTHGFSGGRLTSDSEFLGASVAHTTSDLTWVLHELASRYYDKGSHPGQFGGWPNRVGFDLLLRPALGNNKATSLFPIGSNQRVGAPSMYQTPPNPEGVLQCFFLGLLNHTLWAWGQKQQFHQSTCLQVSKLGTGNIAGRWAAL